MHAFNAHEQKLSVDLEQNLALPNIGVLQAEASTAWV